MTKRIVPAIWLLAATPAFGAATPTPSPTPLSATLSIQRMYLGTGRSGSDVNGVFRIIGYVDTAPGVGAHLLQQALQGGLSVQARDRDSSYNVNAASTCRYRLPNQAVCNSDGPVRIRSILRPLRSVPGRWIWSMRVFGLPDVATGSPGRKNPLEAPVKVDLRIGTTRASSSVGSCGHVAHSGLVCY